MKRPEEIDALQQQLEKLAGEADSDLTRRYALRHATPTRGLYRQLRRLVGNLLRSLRRWGLLRNPPWEPGLQHVASSASARPLVIWAVGMDREALREACRGIEALMEELPGHAPVLVTDVADFRFYSRLGWLVEYLPSLAGERDYVDYKMKYLAWFYRDAPALPASIGPRREAHEAIRQWVLSHD